MGKLIEQQYINKKLWGEGIPEYKEEDLMTERELLDFAMRNVQIFELDKNGYEIISANSQTGVYPNFVVKKDNKLFFILVKVDIAPNMPKLTKMDKKIMGINNLFIYIKNKQKN